MSDLIVYVIVLSSFTSLLNIGYPGQLSLAIPPWSVQWVPAKAGT